MYVNIRPIKPHIFVTQVRILSHFLRKNLRLTVKNPEASVLPDNLLFTVYSESAKLTLTVSSSAKVRVFASWERPQESSIV